jgi:hypothetical protein
MNTGLYGAYYWPTSKGPPLEFQVASFKVDTRKKCLRIIRLPWTAAFNVSTPVEKFNNWPENGRLSRLRSFPLRIAKQRIHGYALLALNFSSAVDWVIAGLTQYGGVGGAW